MTDQPNLDALVIRHIADIEGGMRHAKEVIEPRLWEEAAEIVLTRIDDSTWYGFADAEDQAIWIAKKAWLRPDASPVDADFFILLDEGASENGHGENSWLASFTGAGTDPATTVLSFSQDVLNDGPWKKLLKTHPQVVDAIIAKRFIYDVRAGSLSIPMVIDRETLATAFEDEEFGAAFEPLAQAVDTVIAAEAELDALVDLARAAAA